MRRVRPLLLLLAAAGFVAPEAARADEVTLNAGWAYDWGDNTWRWGDRDALVDYFTELTATGYAGYPPISTSAGFSDSGVHLTVDFDVCEGDGDWDFRAGTDFDYGAEIYVDGALVLADHDNLWWGGSDWTNAQVLNLAGVPLAPGAHTLEIFGFEGCCSGYAELDYRNAVTDWSTFETAARACPEPEVCDGVDNDGDGLVDEDATDATTWGYDGDGDGFGDPTDTVVECDPPAGYVADTSDCDDTTDEVSPLANETCNGLDDDCSGVADDNVADGRYLIAFDPPYVIRVDSATGVRTNLYGPFTSTTGTTFTTGFNGFTGSPDDGSLYGLATNRLYRLDVATNTATLVRTMTNTYYGLAMDADGWLWAVSRSNATSPNKLVRIDPATGTETVIGGTGFVHQTGGMEYAPGEDALYTEGSLGSYQGIVRLDRATGAGTLLTRVSSSFTGFGYDEATGDFFVTGGSPAGLYRLDDATGALTLVNAATNLSNLSFFRDPSGTNTYYVDADGDGFGDPAVAVAACDPPAGYALSSADCDDASASANPGAAEVCDAVDDDCDGEVDEGADPDGDGLAVCDVCPDDAGNDSDADGACDSVDLCPGYDDAADADLDGTPDDCDACPADAAGDSDGDGSCDSDDPCPLDPADDADGDGACADVDVCPLDPADDADGDGACADVDACPEDAANDADGDGVCGNADACAAGDDHADADGDGTADACDLCPDDPANDADGDGVCGDVDPCPADNPDDSDWDGACDSDDPCPLDADDDLDGDGACGDVDACPADPENDADGDGLCESDDDCDTVADAVQADADGDGIGDACEPDSDADGVIDDDDNCPADVNPTQADADRDGTGDVCDADDDGDGVIDGADVCAGTPAGAVVGDDGCSVDQACDCGTPWKNHGAYVSCVAGVTNAMVASHDLTSAQKDAIQAAAGASSCGQRPTTRR